MVTDMADRTIRIGRIHYTNVWPIFYHFKPEELGHRVELVSQVPTSLNRAMSAGEIDMGPISSFAYGESFERYVLYPDLSVSAYGKVRSILLFHKKPLKHILFGRIALPTTSATSVNLLKIIMEKFYGGKPDYSYASPSLDDMMKENDAALLIGDDAIKASWSNRTYRVLDLGEEWMRQTGQWMSFAVWAVRKETAERSPELVRDIYRAFVQSKRYGLSHPERMIAEACRTVGGDPEYWRTYFRTIRYDFGSEQWAGLRLYFRYAEELGLVRREVPLQIWDDKSVVQVKR